MAVDFSHVKNITIPEGNVKKIEAGGVTLWEAEKEPEGNPLCFTAEQANSTVGYKITGSLPDIHIQRWNINKWVDWDGTAITLANIGSKLYVRNTQSILSSSSSNYFQFTMTGKIAGSGNVNSMINYDALTNYCYLFLFYWCTSLTTAPELPATTLASGCYSDMFYWCTSLTTAPELPATTLVDRCYYSMFYECTSLTTAPALPATTLAFECYYGMFQDCNKLTTAPTLPATTLAEGCYNQMFYGCTSLTTAPELPATTLAKDCYRAMFRECTKLITPPQLPATTLVEGCYQFMFEECKKLTSAPTLPATTLAYFCYYSMFEKCTELKVSTESGTKIFTCPSTSGLSSPVRYMFANTGGEFTDDPTEGNTYYYY